MHYNHPHLSFEEQADLLISRGLIADREILIQRLQDVGYTRFSAYLHPFQDVRGTGRKTFKPGSTLDAAWKLYLFDRKLRLVLMDAMERVEIALRSRLAYYHTQAGTPFAYADASYFPHWYKYPDILVKLHQASIRHGTNMPGAETLAPFFAKYGDCHDYPPFWIAIGTMDFGTLVYLYSNSSKAIRVAVAAAWGLDTSPLGSWLTSLRLLRNCCAHHCRIWNRSFSSYPNLHHASSPAWRHVYSETHGCWVKPIPGDCRKSLEDYRQNLGPLLFICRYLLRRVAPSSRWHERVTSLLMEAEQNGISLISAGLPEHWATHPLWV